MAENDIKNAKLKKRKVAYKFVKETSSREAQMTFPERVAILKYLADSSFTCKQGIAFKDIEGTVLFEAILRKEHIEEQTDIYVFGAALNCVRNLDLETLNELYNDSNYVHYHFGYGAFIRNNYVYDREGLFWDADNGSRKIFDEIIALIKPEELFRRRK